MFQTISSKSYLFPGSFAKFHFPVFFSDFKLGSQKKGRRVFPYLRVVRSRRNIPAVRDLSNCWVTDAAIGEFKLRILRHLLDCWDFFFSQVDVMLCLKRRGSKKKRSESGVVFFQKHQICLKSERLWYICVWLVLKYEMYIYYIIYIPIIRIQYYNLYVYIWYYINVRALFGPVLWATNEVPNSSWGNCLFSSPVIESKKIIRTHVIFQKSILSVFVEHQHQASFWKKNVQKHDSPH